MKRSTAGILGVIAISIFLLTGMVVAEEPDEYGKWLQEQWQETINKILSGTLFEPGTTPTTKMLISLWDIGIKLIQVNPKIDLSKFEDSYVLPYLSISDRLSYLSRLHLTRYIVAKQLFQPDVDVIFKARLFPLKTISGSPGIQLRILLGVIELTETGEIPLLNAYQWLTDEANRLAN